MEPGNRSPGWPNQGVILYQVQIVTYIEIIIDSARISIFKYMCHSEISSGAQ